MAFDKSINRKGIGFSLDPPHQWKTITYREYSWVLT